ncbi:MAG: hypothetical protein E7277_01625 [Lachnospiraceae bacterium]|jgi:hypothetical protein|nr:hypothetical protein [Lachnospiraceae bacterium]
MENKKIKHDVEKDRNTAVMNLVIAAMALGLAMSQEGSFANGRFVLEVVVGVLNIGAAGYYFSRYLRLKK